jgi:hypothetical protein
MDVPINLRIKFTPEDHARAVMTMRSQMFFYRYLPLFAFIFILIVSGLFIYMQSGRNTTMNLPAAFGMCVISAGFVAGLFYFFRKVADPWIAKRAITKQYKSSPIMQNEMEYTITDEYIESSNPLSGGRISWDGIIKAVESDTEFLLYASSKFSNFLPKRVFASAEQINIFRGLVKEKLGEKAKLLS